MSKDTIYLDTQRLAQECDHLAITTLLSGEISVYGVNHADDGSHFQEFHILVIGVNEISISGMQPIDVMVSDIAP